MPNRQQVIPADVYVDGQFNARTMSLPSSCVGNSQVSAGAAIDTSKLQHRHVEHYSQATGTAVVAANAVMALITVGAGTLKQFSAAITGAVATGADRTVTVDLKKSTSLAAFATVLSAPLVFDDDTALFEYSSAVLSSTGLVEGDILQVTVAVAGAAGNQAQGLVAKLIYDEDAA